MTRLDILAIMSHALETVTDLDWSTDCKRAYRAAGLSAHQFEPLHVTAVRHEQLRRSHAGKSTVGREIVEGAATIGALALIVGCILLITPSAGHAAILTPEGEDAFAIFGIIWEWWRDVTGIGCFVGLLVFALLSLRSVPSDAVLDEPYTKSSDWGVH